MTKLTRAGIIAVVACVAGVALASGDWSGAKSKADDFKSTADQLVREVPGELKKIVTAARSHINDKYGQLERIERDAIDKLDHVDDKDHKDEARHLADEIKSRWSKINDQTHDLRNGSDHLVELMKKGNDVRRSHTDRCDAKDISMDAGHAACLVASGDTCKVIEMSADSTHAISSARDRAGRYKSQLEREIERKDKGEGSDLLRRLISSRSDFSKCKHFETRIDCYKQCPEIESDGRVREPSPSWREGC
jgi:DNA gyrase/topoisomerase IV subunit A